MKEVMFFLILIIGWLGLSSQTKPDNKGAWFMFENQNYNITIDDVVEITRGVEKMIAWKSYHLSNGENFISVNPELWNELMVELITEIDGVKPVNLADSLAEYGVIVHWNDDISGSVMNYGLNRQGKQFIASANFKGDEGFRGLNYKGYLILKLSKPCLNPLRPQITAPVPKPKSLPIQELKSTSDQSFDEKARALDKKIKEANERLTEVEEEQEQEPEAETIFVDDEKERSKFYYWQKRNGWWAYPVTGLALGTATGFIANKEGYHWYKWFPYATGHGSMSGGRAGTDGLVTDTGGAGGRGD